MSGSLKYKYKILIIPGLATLAFIALLIMTWSFTSKNQKLMSEIVEDYIPDLELNRDLLHQLETIQHDFIIAIAEEDATLFEAADSCRDVFLLRLMNKDQDRVIGAGEIDQLKSKFMDYYVLARETSEHILQNRSAGDRDATWEDVKNRFETIKKELVSNLQRDKESLSIVYVKFKRNNRFRTLFSFITILICVLLLFGLSTGIILSITRKLSVAVSIAEHVADGNLTVNVPSFVVRDEAGLLLHTFGKMVENLRNLTGQIKEGALSLVTASGQISTSVTQIASSATETASAASETSTTVEEVRQTALDSNKKAKNVSAIAQNAVQVSVDGERSVERTIEGMHRIESQMESVAESIRKLSEQGKAISEIITTVEDVAEQSQLLAVNASIEAVKAGEQGKGFAVVAQEVKNLADQSKEATARVRQILADIQKATIETVIKTEQGTEAVAEGVVQSADAGRAIKRLAESVEKAAQATTQISVSSQEQLVGMDQIVTAMESIKEASKQNVGATQQVESSASDLHMLGKRLTHLIEQYQI
jgi:methyl-accepting chemotaxis protein